MAEIKFLQIHTLHGYPAVLLNRDDSGLAKRLSYGGYIRTRISSQCLKRHWRTANDANSLLKIDGVEGAVRSREIITRKVVGPLRNQFPRGVLDAIDSAIQKVVYGEKGGQKSSRQPLLLGTPEIKYLIDQATSLASSGDGSLEAVKAATRNWSKTFKENMRAMRNACRLPGGIESALFGRMVTADPDANIDAALHVAHSFTVHEEESESDYFAVVDDLQDMREYTGVDHIGETELTSGLFYGYAVVDRGVLLQNLPDEYELAGEVVRRLVHLIATVAPSVKLGSTAPYDYASWMLVEAGSRQPRSLAEAFRTPVASGLDAAADAVNNFVEKLDHIYDCREERRSFSINGRLVPSAEPLPLKGLADWAAEVIATGET